MFEEMLKGIESSTREMLLAYNINPVVVIFLLAVIYLIITRKLSSKIIDKKFMEEYRKKMDEINRRFKEATKRNDTKALEEIHEIQKKEIMPKMGKLMAHQFKMIIFILLVFSIAIAILNIIDTTKQDDIKIVMEPNKSYHIIADKPGRWRVDINGRKGHFYIEVKNNAKVEYANYSVEGDIIEYTKSIPYMEKIEIKEIGKRNYTLTLDRGTRLELYTGLPFIERIEESYWIFIFFIFILGIIEAIGKKVIEKIKKKKN